ncbi:UDP-N-acetylglucosamine 2-epimerase (non-hydrolyzing) [Ideonella sp. B7]|uniref:non-hydrolyzing UDP-N-acetylglucosamine 2-epimerase n=1 Tax=Ideonella benzenivorans TaxID=2831643 RepID=UPI001CED7051|nr:UDP-N-acetylglucosamine 2-epimerase (non-hydrolyzing) [Ideonella benzenivorans]MCA6217994.1 UDP-N-acetylglucosamine 2-epimerase (non-hydrolyzing) [Ideonella benzenivorans]
MSAPHATRPIHTGGALLCMGTRPEIIKMMPVAQAMRQAGLPHAVLHTGQHQDMAWPLYDFFGIQPDHRLALERRDSELATLAAQLLGSITALIRTVRPDVVLVHGDTLSAFCAAQAAFYQQIPVAHVEAGLRTYQKYDPFPEEKNRELIARLADTHFAPTEAARQNLLREGLPAQDVLVTGNTIVDATHMALALIRKTADPLASPLPGGGTRPLVLVTAHRRENWERGIRSIAQALVQLSSRHAVDFLWPVHPNPVVRDQVRSVIEAAPLSARQRIHLVDPMDYPALIDALARSLLVMTDSGGIQEEAVSLGKPLLVLRDTTERPEVISSGCGWLTGTATEAIVARFEELIARADRLPAAALADRTNPFGDGQAGARIAREIARKHLS